MKACIVVGTRPEIIKIASFVKYCQKNSIDYFLLHTGQHYSYKMDKLFFEELELPEPKYNLNAGLNSFRLQIGMMLRKIKEILIEEKPDVILVAGDTNSVLSGALAANKLKIKIGHIEAGLRSHDIAMVEETNRIITDHVSDYLFAPTKEAELNLKEEGINFNKIKVVGNTVVDAVLTYKEVADSKVNLLDELNLEKHNYFLITAHRPENVDVLKNLQGILDGIKLVKAKYQLPIVWPMHPRTLKMLEHFNLEVPEGVKVIEPLGYLEFLQIQAYAKLIMTDSGGIQEESCILEVPCVTLRENTERPETLKVGCNVLAGTDSDKILTSVNDMLQRKINWSNPFGDGTSAEKIYNILKNEK